MRITSSITAQRGEYSAKIERDLSAHSRDLRLHPGDEVTYVTTALSMVSSGLELTACPEFVRPLAKSFGLPMRAVVEPKMVREFCIFVKQRQALNPAAASLLASLKEVARKWCGPGAVRQFATRPHDQFRH